MAARAALKACRNDADFRRHGPNEMTMDETIIPAFRSAPEEGMRVGRILAGYSELEVELLGCVLGVSSHDVDSAVRALYGSRGEKRRICNAKAIIEAPYAKVGLRNKLNECVDNLHFCRTVRNQYAHCQWYHTPSEGLCFIDLEGLATQSRNIAQLTAARVPVSLKLLVKQEKFFRYVQTCLWYLAEQYAILTNGSKNAPLWSWPGAMLRPPMHD